METQKEQTPEENWAAIVNIVQGFVDAIEYLNKLGEEAERGKEDGEQLKE